jgi:capsular polysaccharide transport system permease protein
MRYVTRRKLLRALVIAPMLLALLYFTVVATNRYVSESTLIVRQSNQTGGSGVPGAALLLAGVMPSSREDTMYLRDYIQSLDLLKRLDERLHVREHFTQKAGFDPFFRLYGFFPQEWFLAYFRNRVELLLDDDSGVLSVRVQGFDAEFAQQLNSEILKESERFINAMSQNMARDQMAFAEGELARASQRLQKAKHNLLSFQATNKLLDPVAQAQATEALTSGLQAQISAKEAELKQAVTYLNEDSYQVKALRGTVEALRKQLDQENRKATSGPANGSQINAQAARFQDLTLEVGFAQDAYKAAFTAVENARIEASRKLKTVAVIEAPTRPETAEYPRRIYNLITLALLCAMLYGVARLVVATIREHRD